MLKILLLPFSLLYGLIVWVRNKCYDWKILRSTEFDIATICVGNLSAGGTGKTPHIEYLVSLLNEYYKTGTLGRGYKRKTRGFLLADENSDAKDIGDEPLQIKQKFPSVMVAVGEDRVLSIPEMLAEQPELQVILLDDAFQHRPIKAGLNILLTPFDEPFYTDWLIPSGRLREAKSGANRADIIIVSRSPENITDKQKQEIKSHINKYNKNAPVFFSGLKYGSFYSLSAKQTAKQELKGADIILFCGIANPVSLQQYLATNGSKVHSLIYPDHYYFKESDLEKLKTIYSTIQSEHKIIITTEKDAARLSTNKEWLAANNLNIWVLPVQIGFSAEDKNRFNKVIFDFVKQTLHDGNVAG